MRLQLLECTKFNLKTSEIVGPTKMQPLSRKVDLSSTSSTCLETRNTNSKASRSIKTAWQTKRKSLTRMVAKMVVAISSMLTLVKKIACYHQRPVTMCSKQLSISEGTILPKTLLDLRLELGLTTRSLTLTRNFRMQKRIIQVKISQTLGRSLLKSKLRNLLS